MKKRKYTLYVIMCNAWKCGIQVRYVSASLRSSNNMLHEMKIGKFWTTALYRIRVHFQQQ